MFTLNLLSVKPLLFHSNHCEANAFLPWAPPLDIFINANARLHFYLHNISSLWFSFSLSKCYKTLILFFKGYNFPALLSWTLLLLLYIWMANDVYLKLRREVKARDIFFKLPLREYSLPDIVLCIHYLILSLHWASENRYEYLTLWMRTVGGRDKDEGILFSEGFLNHQSQWWLSMQMLLGTQAL